MCAGLLPPRAPLFASAPPPARTAGTQTHTRPCLPADSPAATAPASTSIDSSASAVPSSTAASSAALSRFGWPFIAHTRDAHRRFVRERTREDAREKRVCGVVSESTNLFLLTTREPRLSHACAASTHTHTHTRARARSIQCRPCAPRAPWPPPRAAPRRYATHAPTPAAACRWQPPRRMTWKHRWRHSLRHKPPRRVPPPPPPAPRRARARCWARTS